MGDPQSLASAAKFDGDRSYSKKRRHKFNDCRKRLADKRRTLACLKPNKK